MIQTTRVINALDDSRNKSIEYQNRFWLRQHVRDLGIIVCIEDLFADIFMIAEEWNKDGNFVVQKGERLSFRADFNPKEEALLLVKSKDNYYVFLYSPEE